MSAILKSSSRTTRSSSGRPSPEGLPGLGCALHLCPALAVQFDGALPLPKHAHAMW
jgi:hypothetical protein